MTTFSDSQQRELDQISGAEMDKRAAYALARRSETYEAMSSIRRDVEAKIAAKLPKRKASNASFIGAVQ